ADPTAASVFVAVLTRGPIARNEIAQVLGLSQATVSKAVRPMLEAGYLAEVDADPDGTVLARPGRPVVPLRVVAEREFVIGIKLAGGHAVAVAVDLLAKVRASRRVQLGSHAVGDVISALSALVDDLTTVVQALGGSVTRVGIGVGGHVDARRGL